MEMNLEDMIDGLEIPGFRKDTSDTANLRWILRNIKVCNSENGNVDEIIKQIKMLLK